MICTYPKYLQLANFEKKLQKILHRLCKIFGTAALNDPNNDSTEGISYIFFLVGTACKKLQKTV